MSRCDVGVLVRTALVVIVSTDRPRPVGEGQGTMLAKVTVQSVRLRKNRSQ